ncbi:hypothetical protein ALNOE001_08200 [Candidatus Methanobinarius endosymbioticus]|uniref:Uncharacterized protein n=1 Tax=Candidatus Methanobinarius endosymbioticus TaxID=2006182 RepID=A0A366MBJ7_9EURY|nr:hypothetical protein ALNOE001_08200 [Candidatus Methanobinarius endosymbioticus]
MPIFLVILVFLVLVGLSSVSAESYDLTQSNTTAEFQNAVDDTTDSYVILNLDNGNYNLD